jgi:4-hydroxy-tetrahydrodipicolinate synthase
VNLSDETLLRLAEQRNIVGVKDSSGNLAQSLELLRLRPADFAVLTGEDASLYTMLAHGGRRRHPRLLAHPYRALHRRVRADDGDRALKGA